MIWNREQSGVALSMGWALGLTLAGFALPICWPLLLHPPLSNEERLALWAAASATVALWVAIAVARSARHRFLSPSDIHGGASSEATERARMLQSILQNTLEQAFLAVIAYGAWTALADARFGALPAFFAVYFSVGRILFFRGYARGAAARAFGFALTFYPSAGLIIAALPAALSRLAVTAAG